MTNLSFDQRLSEDAHAFLKEEVDFLPPKLDDAMARIEGRAGILQKASNSAHHHQLSLVYATFLVYRQNAGIEDFISSEIRRLKMRQTKATDLLLVLVRRFIAYSKDVRSSGMARKLSSRDASAIRNLMKRGIAPSEIARLGKKRGEGVDYWSRTSRPHSSVNETDLGHILPHRDLFRRGSALDPRNPQLHGNILVWVKKRSEQTEVIDYVDRLSPEFLKHVLGVAHCVNKQSRTSNVPRSGSLPPPFLNWEGATTEDND